MMLLAAAAWLGGAALFAGPMSSMKQAKIDHTAFARFEGERLSGFESYDVYEFSEHKPEGRFDLRPPGAIDRRPFGKGEKCRDTSPFAAPEPGYEWALGLLLIGFGGVSRWRKQKQSSDSR
jgi:hypothetical protein